MANTVTVTVGPAATEESMAMAVVVTAGPSSGPSACCDLPWLHYASAPTGSKVANSVCISTPAVSDPANSAQEFLLLPPPSIPLETPGENTCTDS